MLRENAPSAFVLSLFGLSSRQQPLRSGYAHADGIDQPGQRDHKSAAVLNPLLSSRRNETLAFAAACVAQPEATQAHGYFFTGW